jgi:hypothetical protein
MKLMAVQYTALQPGDTFSDGVSVTDVWNDEDGLWLETDDDSKGYIHNPNRKVYVESH